MLLRINKTLARLFPNKALKYKAYKSLIENENSFLYKTGWMQSLGGKKPLDGEGNIIPWMNYPVVNLLKNKLTRDLVLFEYGSGYSTLFYAERVKEVVSVEYDEEWFNLMSVLLPSNARVVFKAVDVAGDYCRVVSSTKMLYDLVIVDGRDRVNCVKESMSCLSEKGVVLLDDTHRERYKDAFNYALSEGYNFLDLEGFKATGPGLFRTTIFYRDGNCLGL